MSNFTSSFSDGRPFCYIIHHYFPSMISLDDISSEETMTSTSEDVESEAFPDVCDKAWSYTFSPSKNMHEKMDIELTRVQTDRWMDEQID